MGVAATGHPHDARSWVGVAVVATYGLSCAARAWAIEPEARETALLECPGAVAEFRRCR
ncbi:MAG: hypothetical protein ACRDRZ_18940 [Pseudonocardiaceae bacterium]